MFYNTIGEYYHDYPIIGAQRVNRIREYLGEVCNFDHLSRHMFGEQGGARIERTDKYLCYFDRRDFARSRILTVSSNDPRGNGTVEVFFFLDLGFCAAVKSNGWKRELFSFQHVTHTILAKNFGSSAAAPAELKAWANWNKENHKINPDD